MALKVYLALSLVYLVSASPLKSSFWKGTALNSVVEKVRSSCETDDTFSCFQYKIFTALDTILQDNYFNLPENVEVSRNSYHSKETLERLGYSLEKVLKDFFKSHNVKIDVPAIGYATLDAKDLDNEAINLKLNFSTGGDVEARKKSKLKKIFIPILVFVLLKAITLIPFAIGVLGLKAWNGLQLAFFSFIISTGLAIFQMCQKLAADSTHAHVTAIPGAWETVAARNDANQIAYSGLLF